MPKRIVAVLVLLPFIASGCAGMGSVARQLKGDSAIVIVNISTVYGTGKLVRIGGSTNEVSVTPDGTVTVNGGRH